MNKLSKMNSFVNSDVEDIFLSYPSDVRVKLMELRQLIFDTVAKNKEVDKLEETIKWGQASYLNKNGSTIRIDSIKSKKGKYGMYFICHTNLVESFKTQFADKLSFIKNRCIIFDVNNNIPLIAVESCIKQALTYHLNKNKYSSRDI